MSIPKHVDPTSEDRKAFAPYNFVPLPDENRTIEPLEDHSRYHADLLTGKLACTLTTASPLYVRAARTLDEYTHKDDRGNSSPITPSDPFYGEAKEDLLIPGSSLRGMLRTMVEIISQSKLQPVSQKSLFFRSVEKSSIGDAYRERMTGGDLSKQGWYPRANAGYVEIQKGDYCIRPARKILGTQFYRVEEDVARSIIGSSLQNMAYKKDKGGWSPNKPYKWMRRQVWFQPTAPKSHLPKSPQFYAEVSEIQVGQQAPGDGWKPGWFIASGWVPSRRGGGKHLHWVVGPPVEDDEQLIPIMDDDIDLYKESGISQKIEDEGMSVLPDTPGQQIPCFYTLWQDEEGRQRLSFGHTAMFRLPYTQSPFRMIPSQLQQDSGDDLAEALFGMVGVGKQDRKGIAGRVFVTDARFDGDVKNALMTPVVISTQALSSPKPTSFQNYLTQEHPYEPTKLFHYDDDPEKDTTLRGHKLYWHRGDENQVKIILSKAMEPRDPRDRNEFRPVKSNQTFTFTIHFENLRPEELGALLWVLDKASDSKYRLKLGMGKPYGLGSVAITYTLHLSNCKDRYSDLFKGDQWNEGWLSATDVHKKFTDACKKFAVWLLKDERATVEQVDNQERIQHLLALLTWEGHPPVEETGYMHLDEFSGKRSNDNPRSLSKRPVLPLPKTVLGGFGDQQIKPHSPPPQSAQASPSTRLTRKEAPKVRPQPVDKPPAELKPGDVIQATVYDPAGGDILLTPATGGSEDYAIVRAGNRGTRRFRAGEKTLLYVLRISGDNENGWEFDCRPAEA